jgi:hypothetical protein
MIRVTARDLETLLLSASPRFQAIIRRSRAGYLKKGGVGLDDAQRLIEREPEPKRAMSRTRGTRR